MNNLSETFEKKLNQLNIKKQVDAAMICEAFDRSIAEVFGEFGKKNVRTISYKNNVLKVGVTSSSWANEINLKQLEFRNKEIVRIVYELGD